jgi:release factor glutamine methyltransferase
MNLIDLKQSFLDELKGIYPREEIESFFFLLTEHHLNKRRLDIALQPGYKVTDTSLELFQKDLSQLKVQYPIQYIIGKADFMGLSFETNKDVLIPRPETEELITWILSLHKHKEAMDILDIGTGSGCIPVALAKNMKEANVEAIDISEKALSVAKKNALSNKVRIQFSQVDILQIERLEKAYDLIISNPPYVRESEKAKMQANVLKYEPEIALYVDDANPLIFYERIGKLAHAYLKKGGELFFEINQYLGKPLMALLKSYGYKKVELKKDIFGADRMIRAVKN